MLRTNITLLEYIGKLYNAQTSTKEIVLQSYPKGSLLYKQDVSTCKVCIIKNGFVKSFYSEENGKDFIFEFLGEGEILGEIEALRNIKCLCSVETVSDVQVYSFSGSYFKSLCNTLQPFSNLLLIEQAKRIFNTSRRAAYQQLYSIKYALSDLLKMQEIQNIRLSKTDMASYLGIDIRSLNRLLKELSSSQNTPSKQKFQGNR